MNGRRNIFTQVLKYVFTAVLTGTGNGNQSEKVYKVRCKKGLFYTVLEVRNVNS